MIINEKVKLGKLEVNLDKLAKFIAKAKKKGFAGGGEYVRQKDGSNVFTFQEGDFHYADKYWGSAQAPGYELVSWVESDQGLWFMSYCGGMLPEFQEDKKLAEKTFAFLKKVLTRVTPERPFRGPLSSRGRIYHYDDFLTGDLKRFKGKEYITNLFLDKRVFSQDYIGGLVIPK